MKRPHDITSGVGAAVKPAASCSHKARRIARPSIVRLPTRTEECTRGGKSPTAPFSSFEKHFCLICNNRVYPAKHVLLHVQCPCGFGAYITDKSGLTEYLYRTGTDVSSGKWKMVPEGILLIVKEEPL